MDSRTRQTRRRHHKSRQGCSACKKRHIRCDETRPVCLNCKSADILCPYGADGNHRDISTRTTPAQAANSPHVAIDTDSHPSTASAIHTPLSTHDANTNLRSDASSADYDIVHLRLFHHFQTESCTATMATPDQVELYRELIIKHAFVHQFLMSKLLAIGALHLSMSAEEADADRYRHLSSLLLGKALAQFNEKQLVLNSENFVASILFSHLVGLQSFCETILARETSIGAFISRLIETISLMQGMRSIITPWWSRVGDTELGPFVAKAQEQKDSSQNDIDIKHQLSGLFNNEELSEARLSIYNTAIEGLDRELARSKGNSTTNPTTFMVFTWLIIIPQELTVLLEQRRPEALVLLAWFAVILHRHRNSWVIRGSGVYIFQLIEDYLGTSWAPYLSWPKEQLSMTL